MRVFATYLPATVTYAPPPNGNPGTVPPWLQDPVPGAPPADDHTPRVLGAAQPTVWIPDQPEPVNPDIPRIM